VSEYNTVGIGNDVFLKEFKFVSKNLGEARTSWSPCDNLDLSLTT
jgi:hypothetical protein